MVDFSVALESFEAITLGDFSAAFALLNIRSVGSSTRILGTQEALLIYDVMTRAEVRLSKIERDQVFRN